MRVIYNRKSLINIYGNTCCDSYSKEELRKFVRELANQCFDQLDTIEELKTEKADFIESLEEFKANTLPLLDQLEEEVASLRQEHKTEVYWFTASIGHLEEWNRKLRARNQGLQEENRTLTSSLSTILS